MRKVYAILMVVVMMALCVLLSETNSHAFGVGPYLEYATGSGEGDGYNFSDTDINVAGFGIALDTNLSKHRLFNYRLSLGYNDLDVPGDVEAYRISLDNTFGFAIVRKKNFRLWVGPQLHVSRSNWKIPTGGMYGSGWFDTKSYDYRSFTGPKESIDFIGYGTGAVIGVNIILPKGGAICPEFGVRWIDYTSDKSKESYYSYFDWGNRYADYSYNETVVFFKLAFMFGK